MDEGACKQDVVGPSGIIVGFVESGQEGSPDAGQELDRVVLGLESPSSVVDVDTALGEAWIHVCHPRGTKFNGPEYDHRVYNRDEFRIRV